MPPALGGSFGDIFGDNFGDRITSRIIDRLSNTKRQIQKYKHKEIVGVGIAGNLSLMQMKIQKYKEF